MIWHLATMTASADLIDDKAGLQGNGYLPWQSDPHATPMT